MRSSNLLKKRPSRAPHLFALSLVGLSACSGSSLFGENRGDSTSMQSAATAELARDESVRNTFRPGSSTGAPTTGDGTTTADSGGTTSGGITTDTPTGGGSTDTGNTPPPAQSHSKTLTLAENVRIPAGIGELVEVPFRLSANTALNHDEVVSEIENLTIAVWRDDWYWWDTLCSKNIINITKEHDRSYVFTALFTRSYENTYIYDDLEWLQHNVRIYGVDSQVQIEADAVWLFWYDPAPFVETGQPGLFDPNLDSFTLTLKITDRNGLLATNIEQAIQSQPEAFILTGPNNARLVGQQARATPAAQVDFEHGQFHSHYQVEVTFPTPSISGGARWSLSLTENLATPIQDADGHPLEVGDKYRVHLNVADTTPPTIWLEHDTFYLAPEQEFVLSLIAGDHLNHMAAASYALHADFSAPSDFVFPRERIFGQFSSRKKHSPLEAFSMQAPAANPILNAETVITFSEDSYYGKDYAQLTDTAGNVRDLSDVSLTFTLNVYERAESFHLHVESFSGAPNGVFQATVTVTDPDGFDSPPVFDPTMFRLVPAQETYRVTPLVLTGEHIGTPVAIGTNKTQYLLPIQFSLPAATLPQTQFRLEEIITEDPTVPYDLNSAGKIFSVAANSETISVATTTRGPAIDASSPILSLDATQLVTITATLADLVGVPDADLNAIAANPSWFSLSLNNQTLAATSVTRVAANPEAIYFFDVVFDLTGMIATATNPSGLSTSGATVNKETLALTFTPTQSITNNVGLTLADTTHLGQFEVIRDTQAPTAVMHPTTNLSVGLQGTVFVELTDDTRLDLTTVSKEDFTITNATGQTLAMRDLKILSDQPRARVQLTVDAGTQAATYTLDVTGEILDWAGNQLGQHAIRTSTAQTAQIVVHTSVISITLESEMILGIRQADRLLDGSLVVRVAVDAGKTFDLKSLARLSASLVSVDDQTTLGLSVLAHEADGDDILVTLGATNLADTDMGLYQLALSGTLNTTQGDVLDMSVRAPSTPIVVAPHALIGPPYGGFSVVSPEFGLFFKLVKPSYEVQNDNWYRIESGDLPVGTTLSLPTSGDMSFATENGANILATDISGDGKDEWLFGKYETDWIQSAVRSRNNSGIVVIDLSTQGRAYIQGRSAERLGYKITPAGDVNGDGVTDLLIGAFMSDTDNTSGQFVRYVIYGGQSWLTDGGVLDLENLTAEFGVRLIDNDGDSLDSYAALGDINNDGYDDFALNAMYRSYSYSSPHNNKHSSVYVVYGRESLPLEIDLDALDGVNGAKLYLQDQVPVYFDRSKVIATDFNADGISDVIVAVDNSLGNYRYAGFVKVYFGGEHATNHGLKPAQQLHSLTLKTPNAVLLSTSPIFGVIDGLDRIGDLNGDGFDDVSLYIFGNDNIYDTSMSHILFLYSSSSWRAGSDREILSVQGPNLNPEVGRDEGIMLRNIHSVDPIGDINGDGYDDVFVCRKGMWQSSDFTRVLFGSATGLNYLDPLDGAHDGVIDFNASVW